MLDKHMDILSNIHRRRLLIALSRENPQNDGTEPIWDQKHRERSILLQHMHLPTLEDHGYIDWDRASKQVVKGPKFDKIKPLLTLFVENQETLSDEMQSD